MYILDLSGAGVQYSYCTNSLVTIPMGAEPKQVEQEVRKVLEVRALFEM